MSDRTMDRLVKGVRERHEEFERGRWLSSGVEPYAGSVYSTCNLYGHPPEAHWHPPVGPTPAAFPDTGLDALRALSDAATPGPWVDHWCPGAQGGAECWREPDMGGHHDVFVPDPASDGSYGSGVIDVESNTEVDPQVAFAVAAVNYVRSRLAQPTGEERPA